jgi:hypothetical protein
VSSILMPEDPAFQRFERLVDALGTGPTHSAYEQAALARIVSWASPTRIGRARGISPCGFSTRSACCVRSETGDLLLTGKGPGMPGRRRAAS